MIFVFYLCKYEHYFQRCYLGHHILKAKGDIEEKFCGNYSCLGSLSVPKEKNSKFLHIYGQKEGRACLMNRAF